MSEELVKPRFVRYADLATREWTFEVPEHEWNEVEQAFVAIIDAAEGGPKPEAFSSHMFLSYVEGFGMSVWFHTSVEYYTATVDLRDRHRRVEEGELHGYSGPEV